MAASAIFNQGMTAAQAHGVLPAAPTDDSTKGANGTGGTSGTSSESATISANDFLTLLVTEMQNQDPTANTDPNEYINQLVNVNSLEQLIDINQTLTTGFDGTSASTGSGASGHVTAATPGVNGASPAGTSALSSGIAQASKAMPAAPASASPFAPGNLAVPAVNAAAQHVAHALEGRTRTHSASNSFSAVR